MDDFKASLEKTLLRAKATSTPPVAAPPPPEIKPAQAFIPAPPPPEAGVEAVPAPAPTAEKAPAPFPEPEERSERLSAPAVERSNLNRVTVNLFADDHQALSVIAELLGSRGNSFANRSDAIKVALRYAAKARAEDLAKLYADVKSQDKRFRSVRPPKREIAN